MTVLYETTAESFYEDMDGCEYVLVDFYKDPCAPCSTLYPELIKLEEDSDFPCSIMKLNYDTEENANLVMDLRVRAAPTLILFKNGKKFRTAYGKGMTAEKIREWFYEQTKKNLS